MMRSRALPENFDVAQTMQSPFSVQTPMMSAPMAGNYTPYGAPSTTRPLTVETLRQAPNYDSYSSYYASPHGIGPANASMDTLNFMPLHPSAAPLSPTSGPSQNQAQDGAVRLQYGASTGSQPSYAAQTSYASREPSHDRWAMGNSEVFGQSIHSGMPFVESGTAGTADTHGLDKPMFLSGQSSVAQDRSARMYRDARGIPTTVASPYGTSYLAGE